MHAQFHANAGRVAGIIESGALDSAIGELGPNSAFDTQSKDMSRELVRWQMELRKGG